ncbi:MAG: hypothetical protein JJE45_00380 [Prolixibacteraceae bacterium]|nr:hypothetical protein [Prolixibacteraceae bacterium]
MEILVKNITSPVSSPFEVYSRILMDKAAGDVPLSTTMKMIEDLGLQYPCEKSKVKKHLGIFECPLCKQPFRASIYAIKHGHTKACRCSSFGTPKHRMWRHPLYKRWSMMKGRCFNPNSPSYKDYGSRGISVCKEWNEDFINFYEWAKKEGYTEGQKYELNRRDNDKGYNPENCEFTTHSINNQNTRLIQNNNTSGFRGVFYHKRKKDAKKWMSQIGFNGKFYYLGYFEFPEQAAQAYNNFIITHKTNHPLNKF